jgi:hypothetical protein
VCPLTTVYLFPLLPSFILPPPHKHTSSSS